MGHSPDNRGIRTVRDLSGGETCNYNDTCEAGEEVDEGVDDIDYESETSDYLPSLREIFAQSDTEFGVSPSLGRKTSASPAPVKGTGKECGREGDSEDSANPATTAVTSVQPGTS